jgi:hypothetical protein
LREENLLHAISTKIVFGYLKQGLYAYMITVTDRESSDRQAISVSHFQKSVYAQVWGFAFAGLWSFGNKTTSVLACKYFLPYLHS